MPSWNDLLQNLASQPDDVARTRWIAEQLQSSLVGVSDLRGGRNVLLYGSAFLQKPWAPYPTIAMTQEDLNGFMSTIHQMDWTRGLTVLLHTPGGDPHAAETIMSYLRTKFSDLEVIVPTFAMSAGTMFALGSDRVFMGRQSQLGPIDPQMTVGGRPVSAPAIVEQFERARAEVLANTDAAHVWAPITASLGPALLVEAQNAIDFGESLVARWLASYMLAGQKRAATRGKEIAHFFSDASMHKSHGRRIGRDEARGKGLVIEDLEESQDLQEHALTAYHVMTIAFEHSQSGKMLASHAGRQWIKSHPIGTGVTS